jgi:hypothetical protein
MIHRAVLAEQVTVEECNVIIVDLMQIATVQLATGPGALADI